MRKSKEEHQAKLNYIVRTLFIRNDLGNLLSIFKKERIRKVINLLSLTISDLENLGYALPSKETSKLKFFEIGLIVIFKEFIQTQKLGLRSNITFEEFTNFRSKQRSSKRRSSANSITALPHSPSSK